MRHSKDKTVSKEGIILIHLIEEKGWNLLNGNMNEDENGEYTFRIESDHQPILIELKVKVKKERYNKDTK